MMDAERHLPLARCVQPRYATVWTVCRPDVTVLADWASTPRYLLWTVCRPDVTVLADWASTPRYLLWTIWLGLVFAGPSCASALDWTLELKKNSPSQQVQRRKCVRCHRNSVQQQLEAYRVQSTQTVRKKEARSRKQKERERCRHSGFLSVGNEPQSGRPCFSPFLAWTYTNCRSMVSWPRP